MLIWFGSALNTNLIRMNNVYLFCLLFAAQLALQSCRSNPANLKTEAEEPASQIEFDEVDGDAVPDSMWSPGQRKASAEHYFLVAEYMSMSGDSAKAARLVEAAYNLDPNPFLGAKLISLEAGQAKLEDIMPQAKRMVLLYPKSYRLRLHYGQLLARQNRYEDAVAELEKAIDLTDSDEEVYIELISLHQKAGEVSKAIVIAKELVENVPNSIVGHATLAKLYFTSGQKEKALKAAETAYEMQTSNAELILIYALALELNGNSSRAVSLYEQLYRLNPANDELIGRMIELYRQLGDLKVSLELLDELAQLPGGDRPGIQMQRSIILWEMGKHEEASQLLDKLATDFPQSERLQYMAGWGKERLKQWQDAINFYLRVGAESTLRPEADFRRAVILKELKEHKASQVIVTDLLKSSKPQWEVYVLAADNFSELNDFKSAIEVLKKCLDVHSDKSARIWFLIGVYQEKSGDKAGSIVSMRRVIQLDPANSSAFNFLGYVYAESGENLDEAEQLIKRALELKPNEAYYLDSLGWVYFQQGKLELAEQILLQAHELSPEEGVILEHLGEIEIKKANLNKAREYYERALKTKLDPRDQIRIEKRYNAVFAK
jgi:tetratricopeptide (TPR) repeat protein